MFKIFVIGVVSAISLGFTAQAETSRKIASEVNNLAKVTVQLENMVGKEGKGIYYYEYQGPLFADNGEKISKSITCKVVKINGQYGIMFNAIDRSVMMSAFPKDTCNDNSSYECIHQLPEEWSVTSKEVKFSSQSSSHKERNAIFVKPSIVKVSLYSKKDNTFINDTYSMYIGTCMFDGSEPSASQSQSQL